MPEASQVILYCNFFLHKERKTDRPGARKKAIEEEKEAKKEERKEGRREGRKQIQGSLSQPFV